MTFSEQQAHNKRLIIGYTTKSHLCLDLDNVSLCKAVALAKLIQKDWPQTGDCLVLRSSRGTGKTILKGNSSGLTTETIHRDNYHLVFDNRIEYSESCDITECLASCDLLDKDYMQIRKIRNDMTLRVSPAVLSDKTKPAPEPAAWVFNSRNKKRDGMIEAYLSFHRSVSQFWQS